MKSPKLYSWIIPLLLLLLILISCDRASEPGFVRHIDFNNSWEFKIDDSGWKVVHLPHDWSIIDYMDQDSLHVGPFFKDLPGGDDVGYLRDGTAWYRKVFTTPAHKEGKQYILNFDGVQTQMVLWVNGVKIGEHVHGYTPFQFNITVALNGPGEDNLIAVKTVNEGENSRWYAGAGIYRPVTMSILNPVAVSPWGVFITTPDISESGAGIQFEVSVQNKLATDAEVQCQIKIISPAGEVTDLTPVSMVVDGDSESSCKVSGRIPNPALWNLEDPNLYRAEVTLIRDGNATDLYSSSFGIRTIGFGVNEGFLLNGQEVLLKGACIHHDNGLLGAAAFPMAEYRRVRILKENGFNAIRTSHNPPSEAFLEACDELGMLVIDESFDHWVMAKRPNDYSNYFKEWHIKDVKAMVLRDRNHPAVVMWSFGNEVQERADPEGIEIAKTLIAAIREVDNTRPVTQAICDFWDNPGKEWDYSAGAFEPLDIGGYNYKYGDYESDHIKYPERMMYGSESFPLSAWENWEMVKNHKYVFGDFVWTGMDYLGESGIGHNFFSSDSEPASFLTPWPWYNAWCGDIDITGNKKPQSFYRDVVWGESRLEMMVSRPVPPGKTARISRWGWHDELGSWNWEGHEGRMMDVRVYSAYPEVRLELNGESIATRTVGHGDKYIAEFQVKYTPGVLKATGIDGGTDVESTVLKTASIANSLHLAIEAVQIKANRASIAYIDIRALDRDDIVAITNDSNVMVKVSGPALLLAAGNANPQHQGSFTDQEFPLFRGHGQVIIRSNGEPGEILVELFADGMEPASVKLEAL